MPILQYHLEDIIKIYKNMHVGLERVCMTNIDYPQVNWKHLAFSFLFQSSFWCSLGSNRPISQIPECICAISHNATFCNRNVHISVTKWCIMGYVCDALWDLWDGSIDTDMQWPLSDHSSMHLSWKELCLLCWGSFAPWEMSAMNIMQGCQVTKDNSRCSIEFKWGSRKDSSLTGMIMEQVWVDPLCDCFEKT